MAPRKKKEEVPGSTQPRREPRNILLDHREVEIVENLDPHVQENWRLQRSVKKALLGYAILDLLENTSKLSFGTWNSRPLKQGHINKLQKAFEEDGLERFDEKTVIPIVIEKKLVDVSLLTQDISDMKKIPAFKYSTTPTPIKCAGGRHRFEALKQYIQDLDKSYKDLQSRRDEIGQLVEVSDEDVRWYNHESHKDLQKLGGILKYGGQWLVAVYDETILLADGIELAQYLSRNETKHVYMETDEERVIMEIQYLATLAEEKRGKRLKDLRARNSAAKRSNPLVSVVNSETAFKATEILVNRSSHFLDMPEMNVRWLHNQLCGTHGGLMCSAIASMAERLDLCLKESIVKMDDVDNILKVSTREEPSALQDWMSQLRQGKTVDALYLILPEILTLIDDAWQDRVQKPATDAMGCIRDEDYASAFTDYVSEATLALIKYVKDPEVRKRVKESLHPVLDSIPSKFKLACLDFTSVTYGLPVLTRTPITALALHLERIPLVLMEISRWFNPLVDYIIGFSKSINSPSYTQAAIDTTSRNDCLVRDCPVGGLFLGIILHDYGACLVLETVLPDYKHTQRVQTTKELALVIPSGTNKKSGQDQTADEDGTKKLRTRQTSQPSPQETQAKAQLALLKSQYDSLFKAMGAACRPKDSIPLKTNRNLAIPGANLLLHSSWNWQNIASSSRSREFHGIAGVAVLEFNIINEYRETLLHSEAAACQLRSSFSKRLRPFMKKKMSILHTLTQRGVPAPDPGDFIFPDHISLSESSDDEVESFDIADTFPLWLSYRDRQGDQTAIQKLVWAVEKCPLSWQDPSNLAESKSPELNGEVQTALQNLIQTLQKNAYSKRWGKTCDEDAEEEDINLGIVFRGCDPRNFLPKGRNLSTSVVRKLLPQITKKAPIAVVGDETLAEQECANGDQTEDLSDSPNQDLNKDKTLAEQECNDNQMKDSPNQLPSSPSPTQADENFQRLYPPAQRLPIPPVVSPSPRRSLRKSSAASTVEGTSATTQMVSPTPKLKRPRKSNEIEHGGHMKKRAKGITRFAQS